MANSYWAFPLCQPLVLSLSPHNARECLVQGRSPAEWESHDLDPGSLSPEPCSKLLRRPLYPVLSYLRNLPLSLARVEVFLSAHEEMGDTNQKGFQEYDGIGMIAHQCTFCCLPIVGSFRTEFCLLQLCYLLIWKITPYVWSISGMGDQMVLFKDFFPEVCHKKFP